MAIIAGASCSRLSAGSQHAASIAPSVTSDATEKSLDASGGGVFRNLLGAAEGALIRAATSTPTLGLFPLTSIIHISDPHFETWETMPRLSNFTHAHPECDVVAVTGDCTSKGNTQLPAEWNQWPQRIKLSVPGNHDLGDTFDRLD